MDAFPADLWFQVSSFCGWKSLHALAQTCRVLRNVATEESIWEDLFRRIFHDAAAVSTEEPHRHLLKLVAAWRCTCCSDELFTTNGERCLCVTKRTRLRLTIGCMDPNVCGPSSLASNLYTHLRESMQESFDFRLVTMKTLSPEALASVDVLVPCMQRRSDRLAPSEVAAVTAFVARGGCAFFSAFGNNCQNGDYAQALLTQWGIQTIPEAEFRPACTYHVTKPDS
eukprot:TRINITY_DN13446_c0_g1_i1.p1 TRINITY_DN13446_c0_g1~~TRINITY_DN13446_c0_g1_i1.p1  ORF type:complete len:226 (-),score=12.93 TRINITY_DN13446_c0_g1_i1:325-1002(-)